MRYSKMCEAINRIIAKKNLKMDGVNISTKMQSAIELWSLMYRNKAPWVGNNIRSAGLPASICSEISRLVTLELKSDVTGKGENNERAEFINEIYQGVIKNIRKQLEYGVAKGSLIFKPYLSADNSIVIQYNQADSFFPITFDSNGEVKQCAFTEQITSGRNIYTRVELHTVENGGISVDNLAFHSKTGATLGSEIELNAVDAWKNIEPHGILKGTDKMLMGFFRVPIANTIDTDSPLGASIFSKAVDLIKVADKRYSQIDWEYDSKEAAIHIAESMLDYDKTNNKYNYPGGKDRLYRKLQYSSGATDKPLIDIFSPDIRDESYFHGYNQQLKRIEFDCSLAYGTLSDAQDVDKTAEEIKSSKQRSYATVHEIQHALENALRDLVDAIDYWATIGKLAPEGEYEVNFIFDDSIINDKDAERKQDISDVNLGAMSILEYRMKWYGETKEEAMENIPEQDVVLE